MDYESNFNISHFALRNFINFTLFEATFKRTLKNAFFVPIAPFFAPFVLQLAIYFARKLLIAIVDTSIEAGTIEKVLCFQF